MSQAFFSFFSRGSRILYVNQCVRVIHGGFIPTTLVVHGASDILRSGWIDCQFRPEHQPCRVADRL